MKRRRSRFAWAAALGSASLGCGAMAPGGGRHAEPPPGAHAASPPRNATGYPFQAPRGLAGPSPTRASYCASNSGCWTSWDDKRHGHQFATATGDVTTSTASCSRVVANGYLVRADAEGLGVLVQRSRPDSLQPIPLPDYPEKSISWYEWTPSTGDASAYPLLGMTVFDATAFGSDVFVANVNGSVFSLPDERTLPLRPIVGAAWPGEAGQAPRRALGAPGEMYVLTDAAPAKVLTKIENGRESPKGEYAGWMKRLWVNDKWVLRAFSTPSIAAWEASTRNGSAARILAFDGVGTCGAPLLDESAVTLGGRPGAYKVVELSLLDGRVVSETSGLPLEEPHCISADGARLAVGGYDQGGKAIAIYADGKWQVVRLPGGPSVVDVRIAGSMIVASAPDEDLAIDGKVVHSAGAVYVLRSGAQGFRLERRIVASAPRESGLLGFRLGVAGSRLLINEFSGPREPDAAVGSVDGDPVVCETTL